MEKLRDKIYLETPWLSGKDNLGGEMKGLHFFEQGIKYHEYKNMVIQRRAQYVIIFLTIVLLIMTGLQIYLNFFNDFVKVPPFYKKTRKIFGRAIANLLSFVRRSAKHLFSGFLVR